MGSAAMVMGAINNSSLVCNYFSCNLTLVPEERAVFMREQASSLYYVSTYFFAKVVAEIPYGMVNPLLLSFVIYWLIPFNTYNPNAPVIYSKQLLSIN